MVRNPEDRVSREAAQLWYVHASPNNMVSIPRMIHVLSCSISCVYCGRMRASETKIGFISISDYTENGFSFIAKHPKPMENCLCLFQFLRKKNCLHEHDNSYLLK